MKVFFYVIGVIIGILMMFVAPLSTSAQVTPRPVAEGNRPTGVITEERFVTEYSSTVCYGGVLSLVGTIHATTEAGLTTAAKDSMTYRLLHDYVEWGPCIINGAPSTANRLLMPAGPVFYVTACDSGNTIGGMYVTRAFIGDAPVTGVAYLMHYIEDDPCHFPSHLKVSPFILHEGSDWNKACLRSSIVTFPGDGGFAQFRCDQVIRN